MIKTYFIINLLRTDLLVFVRMKNSLLKPEQTLSKHKPVNKSGCSRENELAAFPISSLWRGLMILNVDNNTGLGISVLVKVTLKAPSPTIWGYGYIFLQIALDIISAEKVIHQCLQNVSAVATY